MMPILVAKEHVGSVQEPVDAYIRVVPSDCRLGLGMVIAVAFILKHSLFGEYSKTVSKATRHPQLAHIVFGELHGYVLPEGWAAASYIHGHIEDAAADDAYQLALCRRTSLEMQAADNPAARFALVFLHKSDVPPYCGIEDVAAICLGKVAASIAYGSGLDNDDIRDSGAGCFDGCHYDYMGLCVNYIVKTASALRPMAA